MLYRSIGDHNTSSDHLHCVVSSWCLLAMRSTWITTKMQNGKTIHGDLNRHSLVRYKASAEIKLLAQIAERLSSVIKLIEEVMM